MAWNFGLNMINQNSELFLHHRHPKGIGISGTFGSICLPWCPSVPVVFDTAYPPPTWIFLPDCWYLHAHLMGLPPVSLIYSTLDLWWRQHTCRSLRESWNDSLPLSLHAGEIREGVYALVSSQPGRIFFQLFCSCTSRLRHQRTDTS